jgi:hypothetical protein
MYLQLAAVEIVNINDNTPVLPPRYEMPVSEVSH